MKSKSLTIFLCEKLDTALNVLKCLALSCKIENVLFDTTFIGKMCMVGYLFSVSVLCGYNHVFSVTPFYPWGKEKKKGIISVVKKNTRQNA